MTLFTYPDSIARRLALSGVAVILIYAALSFVLLDRYLRDELTVLISAQLETLAGYVAAEVDREVLDRRDLLQTLADRLPRELLADRGALEDWLSARHPLNPIFSEGLAVVDRSGVVIADFPSVPDRVGLWVGDRDYVISALGGTFAIGRPYVSTVSKVPILPMSVPLGDLEGRVEAVLVGVSGLKSANFVETLYNTRVGQSGGFVLVSPRDELFLASSDEQIILRPTPPSGRHAQHDQAMQGFRGVGIDVNAAGIEELAAVASVPSSGWFLVARIPTEELFAPVTRLDVFILAITAVLAPLMILVIVVGLRVLLRPLRTAAHRAERMTNGELPYEPFPVVRRDEVGHLTDAFNRVLERLLEGRAEMAYRAQHDALTGLANRQLLETQAERALARAQRRGQCVALLFLDLDGFKPINDALGHAAGDAVLAETASRLVQAVRAEDTVARVGGDEFVILLADVEPSRAREVAERVAAGCLSALREPMQVQGRDSRIGVSIGISVALAPRDLDALLTAADTAMYRAKEEGRNCFRWDQDPD
jgi:diguanylate cyclase (GGDEF)-like protein